MIKPITPVDASALVIELAKQVQGAEALQTIDLSNFVSVSNLVLSSGYDNVINQISSLIARVINQSRAYEGKRFASIMTSNTEYGNRILKRKFYSRDAIEAGNVNTDKNTNIGDGLNAETSGVGSQWEMKFSPVLEQEFGGSDVWSYQMPTITEDALKDAFRSAEEFAGWLNGVIQEALNEMQQEKEEFAKVTVLNRIGGVIKMTADQDLGAECVVDLIDYANKKMGTTYTRNEMLTEHKEDFLKLIGPKLETDSERLTYRTVKYHWNPTKTFNGESYSLKTFTPKSAQKMIYYAPLIREMEGFVLPTVFNAGMLKDAVGKNASKAEGVEFWQAFDDSDEYAGAKIDIDVNIPTSQEKANVKEDFLFGILYDQDGIMLNYQLDNVRTTPVHARKGIINTFYNYKRLPINDFTDNCIVYVLGKGGSGD